MGNEESFDADEHLHFVEFVLSLFGKSWNNVAALIGDNCSTNKSFARKANRPFIGCASHRFNLAVQDILKDYGDLIMKIHLLMVKLKSLIPAAKLRKLTHLRPKTSNVTRWSSVFEMLQRYVRIREFLPMLHMDSIDELMPTSKQNRDVDSILNRLRDVDSVTKLLQKDSTTLVDVRNLFDEVMEEYPETRSRLSPNASIVHDPDFETGIFKILSGTGELTKDEELRVSHLRRPSAEPAVVSDSEPLSVRALKRRRVLMLDFQQRYIEFRFLLPTSNMCERLFSKAGNALSDRRQAVLPANFESQMFLHLNKHLWDVSEVVKAMQ